MEPTPASVRRSLNIDEATQPDRPDMSLTGTGGQGATGQEEDEEEESGRIPQVLSGALCVVRGAWCVVHCVMREGVASLQVDGGAN